MLHRCGYERMRVCVGLSPSGFHWRCTIPPADGSGVASTRFSSAQGPAAFDWDDAASLTPDALAEVFTARFPVHSAQRTRSRDPAA